jgi:predicted cupin superfamily sugar epimerase
VDNIAAMSLPIDVLVRRLGLAPHPEGGWFRELYRDAAVTTIYYAMAPGGLSPLHRLRTRCELWHFYSGAAVELHTIAAGDHRPGHRRDDEPAGANGDAAAGEAPGSAGHIEPDLAAHHQIARLAPESPLAVVPPGVWQAARVVGDGAALLGCTVAPAFDFDDWQMPPRAQLLRRFPALTALVAELTRP